MSEVKISERALKVLQLLRDLSGDLAIGDLSLNPSGTSPLTSLQQLERGTQIWIRQATLAEHFGCSRTTIWRALKQLKGAGLITDLNKRHEHRYKIYRIEFLHNPVERHCERSEAIQQPWMATSAAPPRHDGALTPAAQHQWKHYGQNFQSRFKMFDGRSGRPKLEECFAEVTWELEKITDETKLYEQIFAKLKARPEYQEAYRSHWCETYPDLDPIYMNCVLRYGKPLP